MDVSGQRKEVKMRCLFYPDEKPGEKFYIEFYAHLNRMKHKMHYIRAMTTLREEFKRTTTVKCLLGLERYLS